ncbi:hypothetical protein [Niabella aquatica]
MGSISLVFAVFIIILIKNIFLWVNKDLTSFHNVKFLIEQESPFAFIFLHPFYFFFASAKYLPEPLAAICSLVGNSFSSPSTVIRA